VSQPARPDRKTKKDANGYFVSKLTEEAIVQICQAVRGGAPIHAAAAYAGVADSTFYLWVKNGRNGGKPLEKKLCAELDRASAEMVVATTAQILRDGDARTKLEFLGRRFPNDFGRTERVDQTVRGAVEHRHTLELGNLSTDELETMVKMLEKAGAPEIIDGEVIELPERAALPEPEL
jgi:transposase-like protein